MKNFSNKMYAEGLIIPLMEISLKFLEKISIFYILRLLFGGKQQNTPKEEIPESKPADATLKEKKKFVQTALFVDIWILFNCILSFSFIFISLSSMSNSWKYVFFIYGTLRVFEIFIYQLNVIFVHPYRESKQVYQLTSYRRMTVLLIHNFFEILFWFAGSYLFFQLLQEQTPTFALTQSFLQMITYNILLDENKTTLLSVCLLQIQAIIGVFMTILSLARFASLLPKPESKNHREK